MRTINNAHIKTTENKTKSDDLSLDDENSNFCDTQLKDCIGKCLLLWNS